jgi:alanine racemase
MKRKRSKRNYHGQKMKFCSVAQCQRELRPTKLHFALPVDMLPHRLIFRIKQRIFLNSDLPAWPKRQCRQVCFHFYEADKKGNRTAWAQFEKMAGA